ncbi:molybdate ABC transporter permease subunit [Psychrobacter aestuarii]|nr:molybdate ABC transporter permease subunit [Psychrobacter aestuarii]
MMTAALPEILLPLWVSIKLAAVTTACLLLLGTPLAYWLARPSRLSAVRRLKIVLMGVIALPLILPPTVLGFYLLLFMSPNFGVGRWLSAHGIPSLAFSFQGLVIGSILYSFPFYVQPVYAQFARIPSSVLEVATLLESRWYRRFWVALLPQARVGMLLGALVSFAHTIGEFGVVLMIGGSIAGETKVVSIAIYEQVEALNYGTAHLLSMLLIVMAMLMIALIATVSRHMPRASS